jgi:hypothetical protein
MFEESHISPWRNHSNPLSISMPNPSLDLIQTQTAPSFITKPKDFGSNQDAVRVSKDTTLLKGKCESLEWQGKIDRARDYINGAQATLKQRQERLRELEAMAYHDDSAIKQSWDNDDKFTLKVHEPVPTFAQLSQISIEEYRSRFYHAHESQYKGVLSYNMTYRPVN